MNWILPTPTFKYGPEILNIMLSAKQIAQLREEIETAQNPLFIHDSDADGLCSFLLLYKIRREGKNFIFKAAPKLDATFLPKMASYNADKVFILDVPKVDQEFIDGIKVPVFWIDHHQPLKRHNVNYFNPRIKEPDAYIPTTRMSYQVSENPDDIWIATAGCLGDWHMPDFIDQFVEKYPHLLAKGSSLPEAVFKQPVGRLVKMFFFLLKGPTADVRQSVKVLTRITSPDEILNQETPQGKFLYKRFFSINQKYELLLKEARKHATSSPILFFPYLDDQWSFTANLANELTVLYPKKVIIVGRRKSGEMKCSLRAQFAIDKALAKALEGVQGYGGGHPNACGAVIKEHDWDRFLAGLKRELKQELKQEFKQELKQEIKNG